MEKEFHVIDCPGCNRELAVPKNKGRIKVTCPLCQHVFYCETGAKPGVAKPSVAIKKPTTPTSTPSSKNPSKPSTSGAQNPTVTGTGTRKLTFIYWAERDGSTMDKLENAFANNFRLRLYVDGQEIGVMENKESAVFQVSAAEHRLWASLTPVPLLGNRGVRVPAGQQNYIILITKQGSKYELCGGPGVDPFLDKLKEFIHDMFQKRGIRERLLAPDNRQNSLTISFDSSCIKLSYQLKNPKGFEQWSTGARTEKILYSEINLWPDYNMPPEYWTYVRYIIATEINKMEDFSCSLGGVVRERALHKLY